MTCGRQRHVLKGHLLYAGDSQSNLIKQWPRVSGSIKTFPILIWNERAGGVESCLWDFCLELQLGAWVEGGGRLLLAQHL